MSNCCPLSESQDQDTPDYKEKLDDFFKNVQLEMIERYPKEIQERLKRELNLT